MDRLDHVFAFGQRGQLDQIGVGRDLGKVLLQVSGCDLGIDEAFFNLHRHAILVVHHHRMEQALDPLQGEGHGRAGPFRHLLKHDHFAAMLMTPGLDFFCDVVDLEQRGVPLGLRHEGANPLHAHQCAFDGQLAQCAVDGHATDPQQIQQFAFRRNLGVG
ncbi:hypothetical protein D3C73_1114300 [compost metagenome]